MIPSAESHEDALDRLTFITQELQEEVDRSIKASTNISGAEFTVSATDRANKVFAFDSSGDLSVTQELGTSEATGLQARHTRCATWSRTQAPTTSLSSTQRTPARAQPLTSNANSAKYDLIVDAATATSAQTAAASSASSASTSASTATTKASEAQHRPQQARPAPRRPPHLRPLPLRPRLLVLHQKQRAPRPRLLRLQVRQLPPLRQPLPSSSASTATTKASEASTSASTATTKASEAASSQTAAASSASSASQVPGRRRLRRVKPRHLRPMRPARNGCASSATVAAASARRQLVLHLRVCFR